MFGIISFINQFFRGLGGAFANSIVVILNHLIFKVVYLCAIFSFILLIIAYKINNYLLSSLIILIISLSILMFVVFNIYTVSKIHTYTIDKRRASTSSTNTFWGDFSSFVMLLLFKCIYDSCGLITTLVIFLILFVILLLPRKVINKLP